LSRGLLVFINNIVFSKRERDLYKLNIVGKGG